MLLRWIRPKLWISTGMPDLHWNETHSLSLQHSVHASRPPAAHLRIPEIVHAGVWHSFSALESKHPLPRLGRLEEKGARGLLKNTIHT